jgi:hypothetical protein
MTSAIYLNNIPLLGHASHAIKILNSHNREDLDLIFDFSNIHKVRKLYILENFADFISPNECVDLFKFLASTEIDIFIFISEDPNFYNINNPHIFLLNHKCTFKYYLILKILHLININIFSYLYNCFFINDKNYIKFIRICLFKSLKINKDILQWSFRSCIYSKILSHQKNVIIPNKRTLGNSRALETVFKLNVFHSNFSSFDVDDVVEPFSYKESLSKTFFSNLSIHISSEFFEKDTSSLERLCYYNNLIKKDHLSIFYVSISDFFMSFSKFFVRLEDNNQLNNLEIIIYCNPQIFTKYKSLIDLYFLNYTKLTLTPKILNLQCL